MSKPKVCITTIEYPPDVGGVGESVQRIARMLINSGYEVHVAVFRSKQRFASGDSRRRASCKTRLQDDVFVHQIKSAVRQPEPEVQDFFGDVYFYLNQLHQQHQFDLFHAFFLNETGYVTTLLAKENGIPVINSIRGSDLHKNIFSPKFHAQIAWTLENSDWATFVSRDLLRRGAAIAPGVLLKSSAFLNSIVPIDFSQFAKPALMQDLPGVVIGSSGRFRDKKGIEFLLDACADLSSEIDLTLLLIGDFVEKEKTYWEQEIQRSKLAAGLAGKSRLCITGIVSREEALAYLPHLDIYAIPSLHDGCPNALLEAMLAGCPIVGTDVDAIGEILADGTAGLLVEPGNSQQLASAIRQLALQPKLRQHLGSGAKQKVLKQLSPAIEQDHWLQVYQRVLQPKQLDQLSAMSLV
jgi:glycosyltransferase involved in cell wall biosynthesis